MKYCLFLLLALFPSWSFTQTISFTTNDDSNIVVRGKFNDTVTANLVFDTGGGLNIVSQKFFQKIKDGASFKGYFTGFRHDGDRMDLEVYNIRSLAIGNYKITNAVVGITSLLDNWEMDGIISLINFKTKPITIDYTKKQLRLEPASSLKKILQSAHSLPIKIHQYTDISLDIFIPLCVDHSTLDVEFDTGSSPHDIIINSKYLEAFRVDTGTTKNKTLYTPFTKMPSRRYTADAEQVSICGPGFRLSQKTRVDFKENMIHDGIIGAAFLFNQPFTIDLANKRMLIGNSY